MGSSRTMLSQPLHRQNSLYNLTLEEAQNQLGYAIGSMNMDELLNNIWIQESQAMAISAQASGLQRQGSLTLPKTLGHKTVEEVWNDIQRNQAGTSFAEMTLEDFLVKAGVVREDSHPVNGPPAMGMEGSQNLHHGDWYEYQQQHQILQQQHQILQQQLMGYCPNVGGKRVVPQSALGIPANPELLDGYTDVTVGLGPSGVGNNSISISSPMMGTSSDSPSHGKKRGPQDMMEKTVQRRQKRMIKNRESAARSRARKQAYTNDLENEVSELKEENARLKRQQFLETVIPPAPQQPKRVLRRTSSAPF